MKGYHYQKRQYRRWVSSDGLLSTRVCVRESDLHISADCAIDRGYCIKRIQCYRRQIQAYISRDSRFLTSLKPIVIERNAPAVVRDMAAAARKANVGPMAAVAGAIAQSVGKDLLKKGCRNIIVENGGDIFLKMDRPVSVGVFAGTSALSGRLRIRLSRSGRSYGICSSSGTVGHSLSFGSADAVMIVASNAALADAAATATANRVRTADDFSDAVGFARSVRGVTGVLIIVKNDFVSWGTMVLE
ncbi:MAG: UPF0280 family protein [Candidatus Omnitrophota bacterium]